ncbi:MAG: GntR family transcriptional regulator [Bryobacterales bacterium]|nr:GntR family transcriptional regulator [Bryobacterales bacterium]
MFLAVDLNDNRPIYQQLVEQIKALIARGDLREGMALPSVRQVAADLGVNLNTVAIAYRELQDQGLLAVRHGAGTVVASRRLTECDPGELARPLRSALTHLVLAGLSKAAIKQLVQSELEKLDQKGASNERVASP